MLRSTEVDNQPLKEKINCVKLSEGCEKESIVVTIVEISNHADFTSKTCIG